MSRRGFVAAGAIGAAAAAGGPAVAQGAGPRVVGLAVDGVERPLGLESARPQLYWRLESDVRDVRQDAYRIQVASSAERLAAGEADVWDSGKVVSDQCLGVAYGGPALRSRTRLHWRVQVWDQAGAASAPSQPSWWEMGLLAPQDWSSAWIAATTGEIEADRAAGPPWIWGETGADAAPRQFRFRFELPAAPADARLTLMVQSEMTGLWLNGEAFALDPVGQSGSAQAFDLALKGGANVLALEARVKAPTEKEHPTGRVGCVLRVREADGQVRRLTTSADWKTALGAPEGWQAPGFDDSAWRPAQDAAAPAGKIPWPAEPAIQMRTPFTVRGPVRAARLYVTALGAYEPRLNGRKVGDALLAPESCDFNRHALYRVYDVGDAIKPGANVLGLVVGDGWYAGAQVVIGRYGYGPPPRRARAQLEIEYADGARETVGTGPDWRLAPSPIRSSEIYNGEVYDARRETPCWDTAGFDASAWEAAAPAPIDLRIDAQVSPPIRATQILSPKELASPTPGVQVFDFGQNFAGWCRMRVKGAAGTRVELRFAEILKPSGEIDQANLRSARASDIYVLKGDPAGESFEPRFTYHGFRYVEVRGYPGTLQADALEGVVIHSDLPVTGRLVVDNPLIDRIWRNTVWSQRSNFMGVPTDCPQRDERMGWMGDAEIFWDAAAFNMDVDAFTRRFMGEVRASQRADGAFTDVSPLPTPLAAGSPGWADAGVILPWTAWRRYGDTAVIDENWAAMDRYLGQILEANPDHLWTHKRGIDFGDWLSLDGKTPGDATTPKDLIGTAFWAHTSSLMAEMAEASGRSDDAARYGAMHAAIAAAFSAAYVRPDGQVGNDSQTSAILALRFGLAPPALRPAIGERLAANIRARGTLLSTGFLGTPFSLDVLADTGHADLAYSLLLRTEYPSWGYMIRKGATTMWERWNGDVGDVSMNSYNHYAFGAVSGFLFRRIAGIAPAAPGFRRILVEPALDPRVRAGGADYHSVLGLISTRWRQEAAGLALDLTVPPNAVAEVRLPAPSAAAVREGGRPIGRVAGVRVLGAADGRAAFEVGSGSYRFRVRG